MAKENDRPNAADKGKGKVNDIRETNGEKKEAKDQVNGKKNEEPEGGMVFNVLRALSRPFCMHLELTGSQRNLAKRTSS